MVPACFGKGHIYLNSEGGGYTSPSSAANERKNELMKKEEEVWVLRPVRLLLFIDMCGGWRGGAVGEGGHDDDVRGIPLRTPSRSRCTALDISGVCHQAPSQTTIRHDPPVDGITPSPLHVGSTAFRRFGKRLPPPPRGSDSQIRYDVWYPKGETGTFIHADGGTSVQIGTTPIRHPRLPVDFLHRAVTATRHIC